MLFIYSSLSVGGIETFFVRMAKERARQGLKTSILLLSEPKQSNLELLTEARLYASVFFAKDIFLFKPTLSSRLSIIAPVNKNKLKSIMEGVDQIHSFDAMQLLLGERLARLIDKKIPITVGFYHYIKYLWGGNKVALHERINRKFIFDYLPEQSLLFFSPGSRDLYEKNRNKSFKRANTFSLGVVDKKDVHLSSDISTPLKLVAIGRLVEFKTYNFYMIQVIKNLVSKGYNIEFDIYGNGPLYDELKEKILRLEVSNSIKLKGTLDYSKFDEVVSNSDMFIGDGTAIVQAAALGIPSIVGVQNFVEPKTYGYFCDVYMHQYTRKGLDLPLFSVEKMIADYIDMPKELRLELKTKHVNCIEQFTNESCQHSLDSLKSIEMPACNFKYNRFIYLLSRTADRFNMKYNKKHPRRTQFEDFRAMNEK